MKKISVYRPTSIEKAIQILSLHGTDAGVYAGGTDLLIRLKNRLKQAPTYLVDIKKIGNLRYIKETQVPDLLDVDQVRGRLLETVLQSDQEVRPASVDSGVRSMQRQDLNCF